ncbi:MAG: single-stranded DNA-binding protein [Candidatus Pacebacteria bacterium]|nr:single-stranded DNA-binding protein [Candidatus Paceibacterota bacterium]
MYLNKATIIGNLTRDPELKTLPSGMKIANFSLATNRVWKDAAGAKKEAVDYHNIVVFGRQAETSAQYLKKGSQAMVEGRLQTQSWDDAGTGKKMYRTEIVADRVQFGSRSQGVGNMAPQSENPVSAPDTTPDVDTIEYPEEDINPEDIPF